MTVPTCTITATASSLLGDMLGDGQLSQQSFDGLQLLFTPNVRMGELVDIDGGIRHIEPVYGIFDEGILKRAAADGTLTAGVKLVANTSSVFDSPLQWKVTFTSNSFRVRGFLRKFNSFAFTAPAPDATVDLRLLMPPPGQDPLRGEPAVPLGSGMFVDGNIVLQNADGSAIPPIPIPPGYSAIFDNGDGTVSVGSVT